MVPLASLLAASGLAATRTSPLPPLHSLRYVVGAACMYFVYACMSRIYVLEGTPRYAGVLLAPAEGFGLRLRLFIALQAKKKEYAQKKKLLVFP